MDSEFSNPVLSTDKMYFFLEDSYQESDGCGWLVDLFNAGPNSTYPLGFDTDKRYPLTPFLLLTFNTETETETEND